MQTYQDIRQDNKKVKARKVLFSWGLGFFNMGIVQSWMWLLLLLTHVGRTWALFAVLSIWIPPLLCNTFRGNPASPTMPAWKQKRKADMMKSYSSSSFSLANFIQKQNNLFGMLCWKCCQVRKVKLAFGWLAGSGLLDGGHHYKQLSRIQIFAPKL